MITLLSFLLFIWCLLSKNDIQENDMLRTNIEL